MQQAGNAAANKRGAFRLRLETPIEVRLLEGRPIPATLLDISATGAKMRTTVVMPLQTIVAFSWPRSGKPPLDLRGRIASRRKESAGVQFVYGISFDKLREAERDGVIAELLVLQRKEALKHVPVESSLAKAVEAKSKQKRTAYRANVEFSVTASIPGRRGRFRAIAGDISMGGMRLVAGEKFDLETFVDFYVTLPNSVLSILEETREVTEPSPFGPRVVKRTTRPRAFEPMQFRGKVVADLGIHKLKFVYGIAFVDLDAFVREEIGRFIHAVQLYKLRTAVKADANR